MPPVTQPVTRHDLLKTLALLLMLVDHLGFFLFPEATWLRCVGRASAPIWLFLVGYNRKSEVDVTLLGAALAMAVVMPVFTNQILPTSILLTIMVVRVSLPLFPILMAPLGGVARGVAPGALLFALAFALFPTNQVWEYGSFGWLFAAWGWWVREAEDPDSMLAGYRYTRMVFALATVSLYLAHFTDVLTLNLHNFVLMAFCVSWVALLLHNFRGGMYEGPMPQKAAQILHFCGRQTLLLYVTHYILLGAIALAFIR